MQACLEIAEQLLGAGSLRGLRAQGAEPTPEELGPVLAGTPPGHEIGTKCRGIYCTLPAEVDVKPRSLNAGSCHTDGHPMSLGLVGLIDRVEPGGGSFAVWPRSHRRFFHQFKWQYSCRDPDGNNDFTPEYEAELNAVREDTLPVDCYGEAGDGAFSTPFSFFGPFSADVRVGPVSVVLWHHRTAHMAGQNYSKGIRQAVLYDYIKKPEFYDDGPPPADMYDRHRQICNFRRL